MQGRRFKIEDLACFGSVLRACFGMFRNITKTSFSRKGRGTELKLYPTSCYRSTLALMPSASPQIESKLKEL